jgi:hypothetical protein
MPDTAYLLGKRSSHPVKEFAEESKDRKLAGRQFSGGSSSYIAKILADHQKVYLRNEGAFAPSSR